MACGQNTRALFRSWGVAPGYDEPRPMAWGDDAPLRSWGVALVFTQYVIRRGFVLHWIERAGSSLICCELIGGYEQIRWRRVGRGQEPSTR